MRRKGGVETCAFPKSHMRNLTTTTEARQIAAETNRDKSMAEKVQKAMIASTRVKLRGEKEAQRLLLKEQALEEKLKDAELRHTKHIKQIKGKV